MADDPYDTLQIPPRPPLPATRPAAAVTERHDGVARDGVVRDDAAPAAPGAWPGAASVSRVLALLGGEWDVQRIARWALAAYGIAFVLIAFWPTPVDQGAGTVIRRVEQVVSSVTYPRVEFGANILYFVPLGALLAIILAQRHLVVPIAVIATVTIESVQAVLLNARVPSVLDVVANVTGACVGLVAVTVVEWWLRRRSPSTSESSA